MIYLKKEVIIGTRDSQLALWQTNWVLKRLKDLNPGCDFKVRHIKTKGDKILDVPLANIGDKALFTKELEVEMINGNIDLAVHSLKDLPTELPEGLKIGAVCERENACDVLLSPYGYTFDEIPEGARVGTSSLRRKAQLLYKRPDLKILDLRGNLNTRIKKMESGDYDAIVLAAAGVIRMGWEEKITQYLNEEIMLSAVGQGAIAVEIRDNDLDIENIIGKINHQETSFCVAAERSFLASFEGGCQIPIGAHAELQDDKLELNGLVAGLDGSKLLKDKIEGAPQNAQDLGKKLAESLKTRGADEILKGTGE